jgi:hypothetical protein
MAAADAQRLSDECGTIMEKINRSDQWMVLRKHMTLGNFDTTLLRHLCIGCARGIMWPVVGHSSGILVGGLPGERIFRYVYRSLNLCRRGAAQGGIKAPAALSRRGDGTVLIWG